MEINGKNQLLKKATLTAFLLSVKVFPDAESKRVLIILNMKNKLI